MEKDTLQTIPVQIKAQLIIEKIQLWSNTLYAYTIDLRVAKRTGDKGLEDRATKGIRDCETALLELEEIQKELNAEDKGK